MYEPKQERETEFSKKGGLAMRSGVLLMFALGCGLIAALGVLQYLRGLSQPEAVEYQKVVVAREQIDINTALGPDNLELVEWPRARVPAGAIRDLSQLDDRYARVRLYAGEVVLPGKVMDSQDASGAVRVPRGYRVVSVRSDVQTAVSNLLEPGDLVDVIVVLGARSRNSAVAKTIMTAVRVFAVNREMSRSPDGSDRNENVRTVSLLVTPEQAEELMMAGELGEVRLALRGPEDEGRGPTYGSSLAALLGNSDSAQATPFEDITIDLTEGPPLPGPLSGMEDPEQREPAAADESPAPPVWTMLLLTPQREQRFHWRDQTGSPEEAGAEPPETSPRRPADVQQPPVESKDVPDFARRVPPWPPSPVH